MTNAPQRKLGFEVEVFRARRVHDVLLLVANLLSLLEDRPNTPGAASKTAVGLAENRVGIRARCVR